MKVIVIVAYMYGLPHWQHLFTCEQVVEARIQTIIVFFEIALLVETIRDGYAQMQTMYL